MEGRVGGIRTKEKETSWPSKT